MDVKNETQTPSDEEVDAPIVEEEVLEEEEVKEEEVEEEEKVEVIPEEEKYIPRNRFNEVNEEKKNLKLKNDVLEREIEEIKHKQKVFADEEGKKDKNLSSDEIFQRKFNELTFFKKIGVENSYDQKILKEKLKPIAKAIYLSGVAGSYEDALLQANELANKKVVSHEEKLKTDKTNAKMRSLGVVTSSSAVPVSPEQLTVKELRAAKQLGMTTEDYIKFK